jgi:hypothetical protein
MPNGELLDLAHKIGHPFLNREKEPVLEKTAG